MRAIASRRLGMSRSWTSSTRRSCCCRPSSTTRATPRSTGPRSTGPPSTLLSTCPSPSRTTSSHPPSLRCARAEPNLSLMRRRFASVRSKRSAAQPCETLVAHAAPARPLPSQLTSSTSPLRLTAAAESGGNKTRILFFLREAKWCVTRHGRNRGSGRGVSNGDSEMGSRMGVRNRVKHGGS